jgi:hypothetical protein
MGDDLKKIAIYSSFQNPHRSRLKTRIDHVSSRRADMGLLAQG